MNNWFDEKSPQINIPSMIAFGINVMTRHAKAHEMAELLMFSLETAKSNVNTLVEEAFYDSNSCCCTFKFVKPLEQYSKDEQALFNAAMKTISQFEWFGSVYHGKDSQDDEMFL